MGTPTSFIVGIRICCNRLLSVLVFFCKELKMSSEESVNVHIKDINKRKSGEAFHLLLSKPGQHGDGISEANSKLKTRLKPKKEISHVEIQSKIESAERRRKAKQQAILDSVKAEEEKLLKAKQKRAEASNNFSAQAEENLKNKMSQYEEKRCEHIQQKMKRSSKFDRRRLKFS